MPDISTKAKCGFTPYPGNGAYGHWQCQLSRRHRSPHRFNNYTIARIPRVWRLRGIARSVRTTRRLRRFARRAGQSTGSYGYLRQMRRLFYPASYRPIEATRTERIRPNCRCEVSPPTPSASPTAPESAGTIETEGK